MNSWRGLLPLLRHGAAVGLWQLAVEVTSTVPENAIRDAAEQARSQVGGPAAPLGAEEAAARRRLPSTTTLRSTDSPARM